MTIRDQTGNFLPREPTRTSPSRISRDELFIRIARDFSERSTCPRAHVGCVAVRDRHILAHGYNGAPPGMPQCDEVGCDGGVWGVTEPFITFPNGCTRIIHAEANTVAYAARVGVSLNGADIYCTHMPCLPCAKLLVAAGIIRVVYEIPYRLTDGLQLLDKACIRTEKYESPYTHS